MSRRRSTTSLVASPVIVGAVTTLVSLVGIFLAYNANQGLPFVPTYDLRAELPSGAKLVKGNDVRVGGFRVGLVERIDPVYRQLRGRRRAVALVRLKLDKRIEPLSADSRFRVRPRSALGLKYVELTPGRARRKLAAGATVPVGRASEPLEIEDIYETFTGETRENVREATEGAGDALAGRGPAVNESVEALVPLLRELVPVMQALSDPSTRLRELLPQVEGVLAQLAPVAPTAAALFTHGADALAALGRHPAALRATIEKLPGTLAVSTRAVSRTRPVLVDAADLLRRLGPPVAELPRSLPPLSRALRVGTPVLRRSVRLSRRLERASRALGSLVRNPNTLLSLRDLHTTVAVLGPMFRFIAPYQTVCNYSIYFINPLGEHQSQPGPGGTVEPQFIKRANLLQPNTPQYTFSARPWDLPPGQRAQDARFGSEAAGRPVGTPFFPAVDAQGNADCQNGQIGYPNYRLVEPFTRKDHQSSDPNDPLDITRGTLPDGTPAGGNSPVTINDYPGLSGGTYKARQLGIANLRDVP